MNFSEYMEILATTFLVIYVQADRKFEAFDDELTIKKFSEFHCYKMNDCTPGTTKVCGFDPRDSYLLEFDDICILHKVNCKGRGYFSVVELTVCETKKKYENEHTEGFEWEHITIPTLDPIDSLLNYDEEKYISEEDHTEDLTWKVKDNEESETKMMQVTPDKTKSGLVRLVLGGTE